MATQADYKQALEALLPPGMAWRAEPGTPLDGVLAAWADELARVDGRLANLLERESDPRTAVELLPAWEAALGLPEDYAPLPATLAGRQEWAWAKYNENGGQTIAYLVALALRMGWQVTAQTYRPFTVNGTVDQAINGQDWQFYLEIHAPATMINVMTVNSTIDQPLRVWGEEARLEGAILDDAPAHVIVRFVYDL